MKKIFKIEYKDSISMRCSQTVHAESEKRAIMNFQLGLMSQDDYMTQLIDIQEIKNAIHDGEDGGTWSIKGGQVLDQESQDALNDAMSTYTNSSGLTLEQAMERASQRKNN